MNGYVKRGMGLVALLTVMTGCAAEQRQRIVMLEKTNANLTERLNNANAELQSSNQSQTELDQRLTVATDDVTSLKTRLDEALAREERLASDAATAPVQAAAGWTAVPGGAMITIESSILFPAGGATLRDEARRTLDAIGSTISGEYGGKDILVFGHTDDQPIKKSGWKDNYQLSTERALAVVRYLSGRGVDPARLVAGGCGQHRPRSAGATGVSRASNRRVEIFAVNAFSQGRTP